MLHHHHASIASLLLITSLSAGVAVAGTVPEPQARRAGPGVSPDIETFRVYAEEDDVDGYWFMAGRFLNWLADDHPGVLVYRHDLSLQGTHSGANEIVIGDPSVSPRVQSLVDQHGMSTLDLVTEGYALVSESPPDGTCNWRVVIVSNHPNGARYGIATLLQELTDAGGEVHVPELEIRDYPDAGERAFKYNLGGSPYHPDWVSDHLEAMEDLARLGLNTVHLPGPWMRLEDDTGNGVKVGSLIEPIFSHARKLGLEPVPALREDLPAFAVAPYYPMSREGKYIEKEYFLGQQDEYLVNDTGDFDNEAANLDWHDINPTTGEPEGWTLEGNWEWDAEESMMVLSGDPGPTGFWAATQVTMEPGDYYVLIADVIATFTSAVNAPRMFVHDAAAANLCNADPDAEECQWSTRRVVFDNNPSIVTYELPFVASEGNPVWVGLSSGFEAPDLYVEFQSLRLERRNAGFKNLMVADGVEFQGESFPGLPVIVTSLTGNIVYERGVHYEIEPDPDVEVPDYGMQHDGLEYNIRWKVGPAAPNWLGLAVSYTLGVPKDLPGGLGNATTWCYGDGALWQLWHKHLKNLYSEAGGFALDPTRLKIKMDEMRGMNRCGREISAYDANENVIHQGRELANSEYIADYVNRMRSILDSFGPTGQATDLIAWGDMFSPYHNGQSDEFQAGQWLGQVGATSGAFPYLNTPLTLDLWGHSKTAAARAAGWPGDPDISVVASMYETGTPEDWASDATWLEDDVLGFLVYQYTPGALPQPHHIRMFDYAWKHYGADATLQVFLADEFITDDSGGGVVNANSGETVTFRPYGSAETRDPGQTTQAVTAAAIDWGTGASPVDVLGILNQGEVTNTFSAGGSYDVTLTVTSDGPGGEQVGTASVTVEVQGSGGGGGGCTKNCFEESDLDLGVDPTSPVTAVRLATPNPFVAGTAVHFTTSEPGEPRIRVFDAQGRRIRDARLPYHPAGAWQWTWDGRSEDGAPVASGVYYLQLLVGADLDSHRLVKVAR